MVEKGLGVAIRAAGTLPQAGRGENNQPPGIVRRREKLLFLIQEVIRERYDIHLQILSSTTIRKLARASRGSTIRNWQKQIIIEVAQELGIDGEQFFTNPE